jgi:hypothetical protein
MYPQQRAFAAVEDDVLDADFHSRASTVRLTLRPARATTWTRPFLPFALRALPHTSRPMSIDQLDMMRR